MDKMTVSMVKNERAIAYVNVEGDVIGKVDWPIFSG
jgi:hypothetical protein